MNEKQKLAIRAMYNEGRNVNQIAAIYMVSVAQVHVIVEENIVVKPTKSKKTPLFEDEEGL
jgi:DNA-directed RNA polymerase specialized sigma subunit